MSDKSTFFREHMHKVALNAAHSIALAKLQGELEISKCAAVELALNQGLFDLGVLSSEDYAIFDSRYKRRLIDIIAENKAKRENSHLPKLELERQKKIERAKTEEESQLEKVNATLKGSCEQWSDHDLTWKIKTLAYAKKHPQLEYARLIIAKEKECDIISQETEASP